MRQVWLTGLTIVSFLLAGVLNWSGSQVPYASIGSTSDNAGVTTMSDGSVLVMTLQNFYSKHDLPEKTLNDIGAAVREILGAAKPFGDLEYSEIVYDITVTDLDTNTGILRMICSARAQISQAEAYETYRIDLTYNPGKDEYTVDSWTHDDKYLPEEVMRRAREVALGVEQVGRFLGKFPGSTVMVTYLSSLEVGNVKGLMNEWASVPETEMLQVYITASEKSLATVSGGTPTIVVVIDPSDYHVVTVYSVDEDLPAPPEEEPPTTRLEPLPGEPEEPPKREPALPPEEEPEKPSKNTIPEKSIW